MTGAGHHPVLTAGRRLVLGGYRGFFGVALDPVASFSYRTGPAAVGPTSVEREPSEQDPDLEPCQVMDLLELNHELGAQVQQLEEAVRSHGRIGIATGLIMAQLQVDADDAFAILVRVSQDSNRKLRVIAEDVISSGRLTLMPVRRRREGLTAHAGANDR